MPNEQRVPGHRKGAEDMTIKEISEKYHITADTLRYYERVGMIPPVTRRASGIRDYGPKDESWVSLAICMRRAGLPVEAMIEYVKLFQQGDKTLRDCSFWWSSGNFWRNSSGRSRRPGNV